VNSCDVCGKKSKILSDYYCFVCPECRQKHTDVVLLKKIGILLFENEKLKGKLKVKK
jgi:Zn finger protein HypA/HybF involved in hydrogenase expression